MTSEPLETYSTTLELRPWLVKILHLLLDNPTRHDERGKRLFQDTAAFPDGVRAAVTIVGYGEEGDPPDEGDPPYLDVYLYHPSTGKRIPTSDPTFAHDLLGDWVFTAKETGIEYTLHVRCLEE